LEHLDGMSLKALQSLRTFAFKDLLSNLQKRNASKGPDSVTRASTGTQLLSFLSSVGESRTDFLNRLCSTSSQKDTQGGGKEASGSDSSADAKESKSSKSDAGNSVKQKHANHVNPMSEETNKTASSADPSTVVEDDIKKQLKRLTDMLDGFSAGSNQKQRSQFDGKFFFQSGSSGWNWLMEPFKIAEQIFNWVYGRMIHTYMDSDFDVEEFLEGAKDAFYIVNHLFEEGDYETLRPMVSTKLYDNMKATSEHFTNEGLRFSMSPENIVGVYVAGLKLVGAKTLIPFGPEFDIPEVTDGKKNFWFLIYVRFARNEHYKLTRMTGEVLEDTFSRRRDLWTFVRGPINVLPIKTEDPGWTLLSIA